MANGAPHIHIVQIREYARWWSVSYGDQVIYPDKPHFRSPEKVLRKAVRKVIAQHDAASLEYQSDQNIVTKVIRDMQPHIHDQWGSEQ